MTFVISEIDDVLRVKLYLVPFQFHLFKSIIFSPFLPVTNFLAIYSLFKLFQRRPL
jgi:hypothetical protein